MKRLFLVCMIGAAAWVTAGPSPGSAQEPSKWSLDDTVSGLRISPSGDVLAVRYQGSDEFLPVSGAIDPGMVEGLEFFPRDTGVTLYFVEADGERWLCPHLRRVCRPPCLPIERLGDPIEIELSVDPKFMRIPMPDGQVVEVWAEGRRIDFGEGPELLAFDFYEDRARGVSLQGYRELTVLEFVDPATEEVVMRGIGGDMLR